MAVDYAQITQDWRWVRVAGCSSHNEGWDHISCWKFTYPDGRVGWADRLSEEQGAMFERQEGERAEARAKLIDAAYHEAA